MKGIKTIISEAVMELRDNKNYTVALEAITTILKNSIANENGWLEREFSKSALFTFA